MVSLVFLGHHIACLLYFSALSDMIVYI